MNEFSSIMLLLIVGFAIFATDRSQAFLNVVRSANGTTTSTRQVSPPSNSTTPGTKTPAVVPFRKSPLMG